jgi:hypothetical protein|tara:strand:+ start:266 stop:484 length:219 start_codon:yes stop_codon:yes gene_type:complete
MKPSALIDSLYIKKELTKEVENIKITIASGSCSSYDEYRYLVGVHAGLLKLETIIEDLENLYLKDEPDNAEY